MSLPRKTAKQLSFPIKVEQTIFLGLKNGTEKKEIIVKSI